MLGLPIAIVGTAAGVWSAVLAARTLREAHSSAASAPTPLKQAHVELVDASVDPDVPAGIDGAEGATAATAARPTAEILDVRAGVGSIDFKFINRGDAAAVLHEFTISILEFRLDKTPLLHYSYSPYSPARSALELKVSNFGWGSALNFTAALTCPVLTDLFPRAALSVDFPEVASGEQLTFALTADGADKAVMDRLRERRSAILKKSVAALTEASENILQDPDFTALLSHHEQWHIREFFSDYQRLGDSSPRQRWHREYVTELDRDHASAGHIPIRLNMHVEYMDQDGRQESGEALALTELDRPEEGVLWIGPAGFWHDAHLVLWRILHSRDAYAVILDPENSADRKYRISRSIPPGDADRFHVVLASRMSGDFLLQLSFRVNGEQVVRSDSLRISLAHPRNARLPLGISDGSSFNLHDGRFQLGM